jgi:NTE family protein
MHQTRIILNKCVVMGLFIAILSGCATVENPPLVPSVPLPTPVAAPVAPKVPPKMGLALGGGAARGFAHVGVIQVLEEAGLHPDLVAGTSAGSLVASIYASGKTGAQL